jgi:hypothetical protein
MDVVDWLEFAGAAVDCAKTPSGERTSAAVAIKAVLAKEPLLGSDMTGCLLAGAGPVLEIGTRGGQGKFPGKIESSRLKVGSPKKETELTQGPRRSEEFMGKGSGRYTPLMFL